METCRYIDNLDKTNLKKIMINHMNYLQNTILVFENILIDMEDSKIIHNESDYVNNKFQYKENIMEQIENIHSYHLKNKKEDLEKINFNLFSENEKIIHKMQISQKCLEEYKFHINIANNEITEYIKQKKLLEKTVKFYRNNF